MLVVHFLDVGAGDCTIIEFPSGRVGMIDINISEGYTNPIKYLSDRIEKTSSLFRFILTHPHMDHLFGLKNLCDEVSLANFWDINHNFEPDKSSEHWEEYKPHWNQYLELKKSKTSPRYLNHFKREDDQYDYLVQDAITILSPTPDLEETAMENTEDNQRIHTACLVLKITHAGRSIILGGDADTTCWEDIYQYYNKSFLGADVLKASHHGHESGYHKEVVTAIDPSHVIISSSTQKDSDYSKVYQNEHNATIYATWDRKNWVLRIYDNGEIEFKWNKKGKPDEDE